MNRIRHLAAERTTLFAAALTIAFILMVIIGAVVANRRPAETVGWYVAAAAVRLVFIALLLAVVAGLGWLEAAGFTRPGRWQAWLAVLLLLVYGAAASAWAMTGKLSFDPAGSVPLAAAGVFLMIHAILEEIVFRGLIMRAFLVKWGESSNGAVRAVVVASLFFAAMHLVNVLGGNPLPAVLLQAAGAIFLGILLGGLVVYGGSIYPAVILHGLLNLAAFLNLAATGSDGSDPSAWLVQSLLMIPLVAAGWYLLRLATAGVLENGPSKENIMSI